MNNVNFYQILNCKNTDNWVALKKAYRQLVKSAHPDKGGSTEHFTLIQEAKDILLVEQKRIDYDFSFTNISTKLKHKQKAYFIDLDQILGKKYLYIKYIRKIACECKGLDNDCKFCSQSGVRDDEVELTLKDLSRQKDGSIITLPKGGDVDRYGRQGDLHVIVKYNLPTGFQIDPRSNWHLDYNVKLKDYELLDCFDFTINNLILNTKELGTLNLDLNVFNKNKKVLINGRINVYVLMEITSMKLLLKSDYLTKLTNYNL